MLVLTQDCLLFATADMLKFTPAGFVFSVINFLILTALLYRFLHRPLLAALAKRQNDIEQARQQADQSNAEADGLKAAYEGRMAAIEDERAEILASAKRDAGAAAQRVLEKAQKEADTKRRHAESEWEGRKQDALDEFGEQLEAVALRLADAVLRELADTEINAKLLQRLCDELHELAQRLSPAERGKLLSEDTPVNVVTAAPVKDDEHDRIATSVRAVTGDESAQIDFQVDKAIGAGARVEFVSMAVDSTLAAILEAGRATGEPAAEAGSEQSKE